MPAEVIVVDDGSTDETYREAEKALGGQGKLVRQAHRGVSAARNTGLELATGELVVFLDSDDYLVPDFLRRVLEPFHYDLGHRVVAPNAYPPGWGWKGRKKHPFSRSC